MMHGKVLILSSAIALACFASPAPAAEGNGSHCAGDCNNSGSVTLDELVKGITIALGNAMIGACPAFDLDAGGTATVDELIKGVNAALSGCPSGVSEVVVDRSIVFLTGAGQSAALTARVVDAQGAPIDAPVTWTSSNPNEVTVDSAGGVSATTIGSAQVFAEAGGVRSAPTLVIVAEPKPGALLVSDEQVVSIGPAINLAPGEPPGVGTEYEVTLQGVAAPAQGTVVLAAETSPVAGKVVATRQDAGGLVVTLALAPLYELFSAYDIALTIDLSAFPVEAVPDRSMPAGHGASSVVGPFRAFGCDASIEPQLLGKPIQLSLENNLRLVLDDRPGYSKHALEGSLALVGSAALQLKAGFNASGRCDAKAQIRFPIFGWFSLIVMPAVPVGLGAEIAGEITLVQGELGVEGKVGFSGVMGWECGGATLACVGLDNLTRFNELKTKSKIPSQNDMQAKISAQFFVLAGLDASIALGALNASILEARIGPKQSFDLAFEEDQAARGDYASFYDLKLEAVVEPGPALKKAIEMVIDDDATGVSFKAEFSTDLSESPKGSHSVSKPRVRPGEPLDFTVEFNPNTVTYFLLDYNVTRVDLYRRREGETEFTYWKSMSLDASNNRATYRWVPSEADAGKYEFAAFVNTKIPVPLLEVAPNSVQPVEVSCFSASGLSNRDSLIGPLASTCADTWVGTASAIIRTPGLPASNIATRANITWTYDPERSTRGSTYYAPSGSFELELNDPICEIALSPNTFPIVNDPLLNPSNLIISDDGFNPAYYGISGYQLVDFVSTVTCPGDDPVVNDMRGFFVPYAYGYGPYTRQTRLFGTIDDGAVGNTWDFSRP